MAAALATLKAAAEAFLAGPAAGPGEGRIDYWVEAQTLGVNFNMLDRTQGKTFAGAIDKPVAGKWTRASFRVADLEAAGARIAEDDWIVSLYLQSVGIAPRKIYLDNVQITRPRTLRPRPSEAKK